MFRTGNCSSSGGVQYKQLTVFHRASYEESSGWHDMNDIIRSDNDIIEVCILLVFLT